MIAGTVMRTSDDDKNSLVDPVIARFVRSGQPESHRAMEAER